MDTAKHPQRAHGDEGLYHPNEGHLSARGHTVVADALRAELSR